MNSLLLLGLILCLLRTAVAIQYATAKTTYGPVVGVIEAEFSGFYGIPYAKPPVGSLRWATPQAPDPWNEPLYTTTLPPACPNSGMPPDFVMNEDCLYLNVYTPVVNFDQPPSPTYPVMAFIYGGGWVQGSSAMPLYWGNFLANFTAAPVVVVTLNYRLGALGFLVGGTWTEGEQLPSIPGNFGLQDQVFALQWVQDNIAFFGGDPSRVTIFGQSAGAMSVGIHLVNAAGVPPDEMLFSAAIMESNPLAILWHTLDTAYYSYGNDFAHHAGCSSVDNVDCLVALNVSQVLDAQLKVSVPLFPPPPLSNGTRDLLLPWQPSIDGKFVLGQTVNLLTEGHFPHNMPVIIGNVRNESVSFVFGDSPIQDIGPVTYDVVIEVWFRENAKEILEFYPAPPPGENAIDAITRLATDFYFLCPTRQAARALSQYGNSTWNYQFLYAPYLDPINNSSYCRGEACHGAELAYVFHSAEFMGVPFHNEDEVYLSWEMIAFWTAFAYGRDLSQGVQLGDQTLLSWPKYHRESALSMGFDTPELYLEVDYHGAACDFWESLGYYNQTV